MRIKLLPYVLTRPRVWVFAVAGILLVVRYGLTWWGLPLVALSLWCAGRLLADRELPMKLSFERLRRKQGIKRRLSRAETSELSALDAYGASLVEAGCQREVAHETIAHAWTLIATAGLNDAAPELRAFRASLPALDSDKPELSPADREARLRERLNREVTIINAVERELSRLR